MPTVIPPPPPIHGLTPQMEYWALWIFGVLLVLELVIFPVMVWKLLRDK